MCTASDRSLINVQQGLLLVDKGPIQVDVYENNSTPKSLKRKGGVKHGYYLFAWSDNLAVIVHK